MPVVLWKEERIEGQCGPGQARPGRAQGSLFWLPPSSSFLCCRQCRMRLLLLLLLLLVECHGYVMMTLGTTSPSVPLILSLLLPKSTPQSTPRCPNLYWVPPETETFLREGTIFLYSIPQVFIQLFLLIAFLLDLSYLWPLADLSIFSTFSSSVCAPYLLREQPLSQPIFLWTLVPWLFQSFSVFGGIARRSPSIKSSLVWLCYPWVGWLTPLLKVAIWKKR